MHLLLLKLKVQKLPTTQANQHDNLESAHPRCFLSLIRQAARAPASLTRGSCGMQGLYASLELLPMWSGIESDVQLFASGRVLHDDGEWAGGQSLGEGSGSGVCLVL